MIHLTIVNVYFVNTTMNHSDFHFAERLAYRGTLSNLNLIYFTSNVVNVDLKNVSFA